MKNLIAQFLGHIAWGGCRRCQTVDKKISKAMPVAILADVGTPPLLPCHADFRRRLPQRRKERPVEPLL